jgi:hypothetical protein
MVAITNGKKIMWAIYIASTASRTAAPMLPMAMPFRNPAPVKGRGGVEVAAVVAAVVLLDTATVNMAVCVGTPVVTPAAAEAEVVPATKAAEAALTPVTVVKMTWGTVTAVDRTVVVDDDGITNPDEIPVDSVQGPTTVVQIWTVVTGTNVGMAPPDVDVTVEAQVTIAKLELTWAAQIPWK